MFTGIIEKRAVIEDVREQAGVRTVHIKKPPAWKITRGQSINIDGICSTAIYVGAKSFAVEYMPETLAKTTAGNFIKRQTVNLERSLTLRTPLDGHMVQGHVDGVATVDEVEEQGRSRILHLRIPKALTRYVAARGSIAVNGVSLTIANCKGRDVSVALIPHTLSHTNLGTLVKGSVVNIETDLVARYLEGLT